MKAKILLLCFAGLFALMNTCVFGEDSQKLTTAESKYPGLFSSALKYAVPDSLSKDELLTSGEIKITQSQLDAEIGKASARLREQFSNNAFFVLEQMIIQQLIVSEALKWAESQEIDKKDIKEEELIRKYFASLAKGVSVTTEEAKEFYDSNPEMFGGAKFDQVETQLKSYLLNNKSQEFLETHIDNLGKRNKIKIDDMWAKNQYNKALGNPVDKARRSGKPSFINFGATGCVPCDMMEPIREEIKKEYAGVLNVEFVNVNQEQILGSRYGISSIPVQIFFDKTGKELHRHVGFFPKDEILEKLREIGVIK